MALLLFVQWLTRKTEKSWSGRAAVVPLHEGSFLDILSARYLQLQRTAHKESFFFSAREWIFYFTEQSCSLMSRMHNLTSANKYFLVCLFLMINNFYASERVKNFAPSNTRQSLASKSLRTFA